MPAASANLNPTVTAPRGHILADLYSFNWAEFNFRLPLVSAAAVALCLYVGILVGHPGGGLIAGGGAFTFAGWVYWNGGGNWQRIFDFGDDTSHYLFLTPRSGSTTL